MGQVFVIGYALLIAVLVTTVYFSKKRVKSTETSIFSSLVFLNLIGMIFVFCNSLAKSYYAPDPAIYILHRIDNIILLFWISLLFIYFLHISFPELNIKKIMKNILFLNIFFAIIITLAPLNIVSDGNTLYGFGLSVIILFTIAFIYIFLTFFAIIISIITNKNSLFNKKYFPLIALFLLGFFTMFLRGAGIDLFFESLMINYVCLIMFFTIENPDVKVVEQLNVLKLQAESANNAKNEWLMQMRHELNTPATQAIYFNDENKEIALKIQNEKILENTRYVDSGIRDIQAMVSNAVSIVELENKSFVLEEKIYKTKFLIERISHLVKNNYSIGKEKIKFKINLVENFPEVLIGDFENTLRILMHLVSNAFNYTDEGIIELNLKSRIENNMCNITIIVKDTGLGVKKENIKFLFEHFERIDFEKNQSDKRGLGLGLSIVKKLAELMNGSVDVESNYGQGSTFTVIIKQMIPKGVGNEY